MIKILKLQKGIWVIVLGVIAILAYTFMIMTDIKNSKYVLGFSGFLFMLGSLMLLYPILTSKKDRDGNVQLDKDKIALKSVDDKKSSDDETVTL